MIKEFEINDILNAMNSISKIKKKKGKIIKIKKNPPNTNKGDDLTLNNQAKSDKSEILVLDQMIE